MPIVIPNVKVSGVARHYVKFMQEHGLCRSHAYAVLNTDFSPMTFKVGSRHMIDEAVGVAWFQALAEGQFELTTGLLQGDAA
jgi:hypothetical protein